MKLVSVLHFPDFGGPQNQALRLAEPLKEHRITSLTVLPDGPAAVRLEEAGLAVRTLALGRVRAVSDPRVHAQMVARLPIDIAALVRLFRREAADVVQVNGLMNPHAAIAARIARVPVVWQILDTRPPMLVRQAYRPLVSSLATVVMPVGYEVARVHPGVEAFDDRMVVFYPPVDTSLFQPGGTSSLRSDLGIPADAPIVGSVGNINPQKGHEYLVDAMRVVRLSHPDARLVIAGAEHDTHLAYRDRLLADAASIGMRHNRDIFLLGSRADVPNVLAGFDVFALLSIPNSEGTPTAILEAMSIGLPIVATDVASIPEAVVDGINGSLVPSRDALAAGTRIASLLADPDRRTAWGRASRLRVEERFTFDACLAAHVSAYNLAVDAQR